MATTDYYEHTTFPATGAAGSSSAMRSELEAIEQGISAKLPDLAGNGGKLVVINVGATGLDELASGATTDILVGGGAGALPLWTAATGSGAPVRATSPTLVTPNLGTPSALVGTNITGTAAGLSIGGNAATASSATTVVTNANLTGHVTSVGNAAVLGSFTLAQLNTAVSDAEIARTDAANTFTGVQTMTSPAVTTSITTASTSFTALAGATTLLTIGGTGATSVFAIPGTLEQSATTGALTVAGGVYIAKKLNVAGVATLATGAVLGTPASGTLTNCTGLPASGVTGTALTAAAAVTVAQGGTGRATSTTAYALLAAGTTATGAHQTLAAGATTDILVGGGASALPAWTTATGSGAPVRATSPTLVTPTLGVATATSVNKVTLTAPATGSTLTVADGKTLTASSTLTLTGTDSTTMTFPPASANVGYMEIPQNSQSAAYGLVLADAGKHILHPSADTTARTFTIPANASVAYPVGTAITFINQASAGVLTIAITTDTMRLAGAGTTGSRTLAANGVATAIKVTSTEWIISGGSSLT